MAALSSDATAFDPVMVTGPTASGKSAAALILAEKIHGEIISVDSMQVYRGLDIGTAKPSSEERARVPHHLIDILSIKEEFDVARFITLAREAVEEIKRRERVPILCGGTGFYFKAFLEGLGSTPPPDRAMRATLEKIETSTLLEELRVCDPASYESVDRLNRRRVIRAVEVARLTGEPLSAQRAKWPAKDRLETGGLVRVFGLSRPMGELRQRIDARVDLMFQRGLVAETRELVANGLRENRTASQALGYRQVIEHLDEKRTLEETIELVKIRTRQFAKRQMTWFRRQLRMDWISVEKNAPPEAVASTIRRLREERQV